jgi:hypothetical protein
VSAVREFWDEKKKKKVYAKSLPRGMIDSAVRYLQRYGQGLSNTFSWTIEQGITTDGDDIFDVANTQLEMNQVEYGVTFGEVSSKHYAGYVAQKVDILQDQEGFVVPSILDSLAKRMAIIESKVFMTQARTADDQNTTVDATRKAILAIPAGQTKANTETAIDALSISAEAKTAAKGVLVEDPTTAAEIILAADAGAVADADDISLVEMRKGVTYLENKEEDCEIMLMSPNTVQSYADEMTPANTVGDNDFLRRNTVGNLFGARVVKSTYVPDNQIFYFADEAFILYERSPYTLTTARDNITDLYVKFAIEARFNIGIYDANRLVRATFSGN